MRNNAAPIVKLPAQFQRYEIRFFIGSIGILHFLFYGTINQNLAYPVQSPGICGKRPETKHPFLYPNYGVGYPA
jgi:hypothetical protein